MYTVPIPPDSSRLQTNGGIQDPFPFFFFLPSPAAIHQPLLVSHVTRRLDRNIFVRVSRRVHRVISSRFPAPFLEAGRPAGFCRNLSPRGEREWNPTLSLGPAIIDIP
jgi:hypothetical protein